MDLKLSDEQLMLQGSLRRLLTDQSTPAVVRKMESDPKGYPPDLWQALTDMGLPGLNLPEAYGGTGLGALETAVIYEEFGRALCPAPHLETAVIGAGIIAAAGSEAQKQQWLPRIAAGEVILTPALLEPGNSLSAKGVQLRAEPGTDGYTLNGEKYFVGYAEAADRLLVLARSGTGRGEAGINILLVDPKAAGVTLTRTQSHALDPRYTVTFNNVRVSQSERIGAEGSGWQTWGAVSCEALIAQSAWFVGCGTRAVELANTYAKERVQFDRVIGSFQAIAHQLADSHTGVTGARYLTWQAAWARDKGQSDWPRLAATAFLRASEAARFATRTGQQIFGGVGFTNDLDIQLFFRRAKQNLVTWADARALEDFIAAELIEGGNC
ncbi:MAG TPA: acyl-CoA dehydrogenase family protein [Ferrovibrio sp.]|uniref:acyl-CoA dehydrogenase family protein n=1 Tax=Ferrovibrio sp. TaxID=1917215 RepID=UPI002B4B2C7C|nr:acyl-CoA dehydrogenase family protein [Ferrovibrio sp.]HLT77378.1 acyl-CoA dehydrogenase family protein [Ferrovibrio sp.]